MSLPPGNQLGPYEIVSLLGKGGMGEVYRAKDPRLDREVAIKILPEQSAEDQTARTRFDREAKALAALAHPNILSIFDIGTDNGVSYVVMEILEGESLRTLLKRSDLPWKKSLEIAIPVAEGLAAAHSKGITHRDLKPENIFACSDGRIKILDFGLAILQSPTPVDRTEIPTESFVTAPGSTVGTIPYMSPEQLRGNPVDARSDIFSFGVVLYEMFAGRRPFSGNTPAEISASILNVDAARPAEIREDLPVEIDRLIMRCLEKDPNQRFQSAADLAFALKESFDPFKLSKQTAVRPAVQRRPWAAVLVIFILLAGTLIYFLTPKAKTIESLAVLPFQNTANDPETEYLSDGITESLINNLAQLPNLKIIARTTAFTYKGRPVEPRKIGNELNVRAILTGKLTKRDHDLVIQVDLVDTSDGSQIWGDQYNEKLSDILNVQRDIATQISKRLQIELTGDQHKRAAKNYTSNTEAYQLYLKGRFYWNKRTPDGIHKAIDYFSQAIDKDPLYAPAYSGTADAYLTLFDYELMPPAEATSKARAAAQKALQIDDMLAEAHNSLAHLYLHDWKWSDAENEFKRAIELDPGYATAYHWYALCLTARGRPKEAVELMKRAQELDPLSVRINVDLGMAYLAANMNDEAINQETKTLELNPNLSTAVWIRGMAYQQKGSLDEAIQQYQDALKGSPGNSNFLAALGNAYGAAGKKSEALQVLEQMKMLPKEEPVSPFFFALVYAGLGDNDSAIQWLEKAYEERSGSIRYLKVEPRLENIRSDPRFVDLMRRVGLN